MKKETKKSAEKNGLKLENFVEILYSSNNYQILEYPDWLGVGSPEYEKLLIKNKLYVKGGNKNAGKIEFFLPAINTAIECKCQNVSGTAREKVFYTIYNLSQQPFKSILLYQGEYFDPTFIEYAQSFINSSEEIKNKVTLMNVDEFLNFVKLKM